MYKRLPNEKIKDLSTLYPEDTVVAEFAGRDSVAAIIKALERKDINNILPIASFSPSEFGDVNSVIENHAYLVNRVYEIYGADKIVFPLLIHSIPDVWVALNGRYVAEIFRKFGMYSPCIACHAYLHMIRIPIAMQLGKKIISGERLNHDGRMKLNQSIETLFLYQSIANEFDVELLQPISNISDGKIIEELIGKNWKEGEGHVDCAYSGNYKDINGKIIYSQEQVDEYMHKFLYKACIELTKIIINEETINKKQLFKIVAEMLQ